MRVPLVTWIMGMSPATRRFLLFFSANIISWQCMGGNVLVLFARHIDMPVAQVGRLISFMPLSMLLVVLTMPLVEWAGPRRLMMTTWSVRNLVMLAVLLIPVATAAGGREAGWLLLTVCMLSYTMVRGLGVGGWFPWLHEIVPRRERGSYFSAEMAITQVAMVSLAFAIAMLLRRNPTTERFLVVYGFGATSGLFAVYLMSRVPGGRRVPDDLRAGPVLAAYRRTLRDRAFMKFVAQVSIGNSVPWWVLATHALYMRDVLHIAPSWIMALTGVGNVCVAMTIRFWGQYADHHGSGPAIVVIQTGLAAVGALWLLLAPGAAATVGLVVPSIILLTIMGAAYWITVQRGVLCRVPDEGRVAYTNVWIVGTSLGSGLTPIVAGQIADTWGLAGFRVCFGIAVAGGVAVAIWCRAMPREQHEPAGGAARRLGPLQPFRTMGRIAWVLAGRDESNRAQRTGRDARPADGDGE